MYYDGYYSKNIKQLRETFKFDNLVKNLLRIFETQDLIHFRKPIPKLFMLYDFKIMQSFSIYCRTFYVRFYYILP